MKFFLKFRWISCWLWESICNLVMVGCVGIEMKSYLMLMSVRDLFSVCVVSSMFVNSIRCVLVSREAIFIVMLVALFGCFSMVFILIMGIGVFGEI